MNTIDCYFISVDWGTSSLRVRLVRTDRSGAVHVDAHVRSSRGISSIYSRSRDSRADLSGLYADTLREELALLAQQTLTTLSNLPIIISGMISSSIGWRQLPYAVAPFAMDGSNLLWQQLDASAAGIPNPIYILSGVQTGTDVMRGEETELIGLFADPAHQLPESDLLLILPGTHSKHVLIQSGKMNDFATCMTGEMFDLLCRHGVLHASLGGEILPLDVQSASHASSFRSGVLAGLRGAFLHDLFLVRTRDLLANIAPPENQAWLRGLLLGAEIHGLKARFAHVPEIIIAATSHWRDAYQHAFEIAQVPATAISADRMEMAALRGHAHFISRLRIETV